MDLETPNPANLQMEGAADQWEKHLLPALPHTNAVETKSLTANHRHAHTAQA